MADVTPFDDEMPVHQAPDTPLLIEFAARQNILSRPTSTERSADPIGDVVAHLYRKDPYERAATIALAVERAAQPQIGATGGTAYLATLLGPSELVELAVLMEYLTIRARNQRDQMVWAAEVIVAQSEGVKLAKSRRNSLAKAARELLDGADGRFARPVFRSRTIAEARTRFTRWYTGDPDA